MNRAKSALRICAQASEKPESFWRMIVSTFQRETGINLPRRRNRPRWLPANTYIGTWLWHRKCTISWEACRKRPRIWGKKLGTWGACLRLRRTPYGRPFWIRSLPSGIYVYMCGYVSGSGEIRSEYFWFSPCARNNIKLMLKYYLKRFYIYFKVYIILKIFLNYLIYFNLF